MRRGLMNVLLPALLWSGTAAAEQLEIGLQIPQLEVAEYHRPYIAGWIEAEGRVVAANLWVWYQLDRPGASAQAEQGSKWLPDLRQWWRRGGRGLDMPLDGVSSATRAVGDYSLTFTPGDGAMPVLAPGQYTLRVEAAREEGGRELLEIPFAWPPAAVQTLKAQGESELGTLSLVLSP